MHVVTPLQNRNEATFNKNKITFQEYHQGRRPAPKERPRCFRTSRTQASDRDGLEGEHCR